MVARRCTDQITQMGDPMARWLARTIALATIALGGCEQPPDNFAPELALRTAAFAPAAPAAQAANAAGQRLAITHTFSLRLPSQDVETVQRRDLAECIKLGCTVLNTQVDRSIQGRVNARISVRIAPDAFAAFAAIITAAPAEVVTRAESAEDKTIPLLDVEKRLAAKTALRDRLAAMLADPAPKTPAELVSIEKELSQAQGEIEAATAQRDYLRTITDTVRVDVNYMGRPALVGGVDFSPISNALDGFGRTLVASVGSLISFLAVAIPWLPLIALVIWAGRRTFRRWRARNAPGRAT